MKESLLRTAINRVMQMELYFEVLQKAADENPDAIREDDSLKAALQILMQYYEGGQWLRDYELDEKGLFPQNMKRGVLSQDAVYNFLDRIRSADAPINIPEISADEPI